MSEHLVHGNIEPGFEPVREAFEHALDVTDGAGASVAIMVNGRIVVDLWGGVADTATGREWRKETSTPIFSCTKGLMSVLAAILVQDGRLDYEAPVSRYWPEFAAADKARVTVGELLAHRAGLPALRAQLSVDDLIDWNRVTTLLAAEEPWFSPGSGHSYHTITHGWLIGEVLRRITGQLPGQLLRDRITGRLGAAAWIGVPADRPDVASVDADPFPELAGESSVALAPWVGSSGTLGGALPPLLVGPGEGFNDPRIQAAQIPGAGGIATARALATIWSSTVVETNGVRLLNDSTRQTAVAAQSEGPGLDGGPGPYSRWAMGFQLDSPVRRYLSDSSFGHDGAGGQVTFADPDGGVAFAFVTNRMMVPPEDRATRLIDALRTVQRSASTPPASRARERARPLVGERSDAIPRRW